MDFIDIAKITRTGNKKEIKEALRALDKLSIKAKKSIKLVRQFIQTQVVNFPLIEDSVNKCAILKSLESVAYANGYTEYDVLKNLVLSSFEDPNGSVRKSAFYLADWFVWSLCPDTRYQKPSRPLKEYEDKLLDFLLALNALSNKHKFEAKGKIYINDLKPCPFKSIQKLFHRMYYTELAGGVLCDRGYEFSPNDEDVFGEKSNIWAKVDSDGLELHEVEFVREIKKILTTAIKKQILYYVFEIGLRQTGKPIKRVIKIVSTLSLYSLANAIVDSFDFYFDHCFGFYSDSELKPSGEFYELFTDIPEMEATLGAKSVRRTKIKDVWTKPGKEMYFLFDYGDGWQFEVKLVEVKSEASVKYRRQWQTVKEIGKAPEQYPPCEDLDSEL